MTRLLLLFVCFFVSSTQLWSQVQLNAGDILLLELPCYSCERIAEETGSRFSHSGLVLENEKGELVVTESLSTVRAVGLKSFVARSSIGASVKVMRSLPENLALSSFQEKSWSLFQQRYEGLLFDNLFLWNRYDDQGREMLYCSEFIAKFINHFLEIPLVPTPMNFTMHWDFWTRYFGRTPPQGELGNSPASFEAADGWYEVGEFEVAEFGREDL